MIDTERLGRKGASGGSPETAVVCERYRAPRRTVESATVFTLNR